MFWCPLVCVVLCWAWPSVVLVFSCIWGLLCDIDWGCWHRDPTALLMVVACTVIFIRMRFWCKEWWEIESFLDKDFPPFLEDVIYAVVGVWMWVKDWLIWFWEEEGVCVWFWFLLGLSLGFVPFLVVGVVGLWLTLGLVGDPKHLLWGLGVVFILPLTFLCFAGFTFEVWVFQVWFWLLFRGALLLVKEQAPLEYFNDDPYGWVKETLAFWVDVDWEEDLFEESEFETDLLLLLGSMLKLKGRDMWAYMIDGFRRIDLRHQP